MTYDPEPHHEFHPSPMVPPRRFARPRDWMCPLVTLGVAVLWTLAANGAADHVNHINLARLMGTVMFGTSLLPDAGNGVALPFSLPGQTRTQPGATKPLFPRLSGPPECGRGDDHLHLAPRHDRRGRAAGTYGRPLPRPG